MSAGLLKRAAKVLREHANSATPSRPECPWTASGRAGVRDATIVVERRWEPKEYDDPGVEQIADLSVVSGYHWPAAQAAEDARYIALMHPPVALAVAEWLEAFAFLYDQTAGVSPAEQRVDRAALTLAREILREDS